MSSLFDTNGQPTSAALANGSTTGSSKNSASVALGQLWLSALQVDGVVEHSQASRGRGIAARGGVFDLVIEPGAVHASVRMRASLPRRISIGIARLAPTDWSAATALVATTPAWCAAVVEGRLPVELFEALVEAGVHLELDARSTSVDCSCERPGTMCEHAAAVCTRLAELLDADPYLIVTLRGGDRSTFMSSVTSTTLGGGIEADSTPRRRRDRSSNDEPAGGIVSPIAARGEAASLDAMAAWRRKTSELAPLQRSRRAVGRPRPASQAPPAELGVDAVGLELLGASAIERAAAMRLALEFGDVEGAREAAGLLADREGDLLRMAVTGALPLAEAAKTLNVDPEVLDSVLEHVDDVGLDAFSLLGRPRRLDASEVERLAGAVAGRLRTRATGVLLDDGRQVRRSDEGTWAVVEATEPGRWRIVSAGRDLDEVLDLADVEVTDPDR